MTGVVHRTSSGIIAGRNHTVSEVTADVVVEIAALNKGGFEREGLRRHVVKLVALPLATPRGFYAPDRISFCVSRWTAGRRLDQRHSTIGEPVEFLVGRIWRKLKRPNRSRRLASRIVHHSPRGARAEVPPEADREAAIARLTELKTSPAAYTVEPFTAACLVHSSWKEVRNEP